MAIFMTDFLWNCIPLLGPGTPFPPNGAQKSSPDGMQIGTGISTMWVEYNNPPNGRTQHL
jgi:hypothetical protein